MSQVEKLKNLLTEIKGRIESSTTESQADAYSPVSYTHLRAHETEADLVCRLLLVLVLMN